MKTDRPAQLAGVDQAARQSNNQERNPFMPIAMIEQPDEPCSLADRLRLVVNAWVHQTRLALITKAQHGRPLHQRRAIRRALRTIELHHLDSHYMNAVVPKSTGQGAKVDKQIVTLAWMAQELRVPTLRSDTNPGGSREPETPTELDQAWLDIRAMLAKLPAGDAR